jgi:hypothetical protein
MDRRGAAMIPPLGIVHRSAMMRAAQTYGLCSRGGPIRQKIMLSIEDLSSHIPARPMSILTGYPVHKSPSIDMLTAVRSLLPRRTCRRLSFSRRREDVQRHTIVRSHFLSTSLINESSVPYASCCATKIFHAWSYFSRGGCQQFLSRVSLAYVSMASDRTSPQNSALTWQ